MCVKISFCENPWLENIQKVGKISSNCLVFVHFISEIGGVLAPYFRRNIALVNARIIGVKLAYIHVRQTSYWTSKALNDSCATTGHPASTYRHCEAVRAVYSDVGVGIAPT